MITLESSDRYSRFYEDKISDIEKFFAIDSRLDPNLTCNQYGVDINLDDSFKFHFDKCSGACGCFLSHIKVLEKIQNLPDDIFCGIFEDDIILEELQLFMSKVDHSFPTRSIINLACDGFDSSASYLVNSFGAKLLLSEFNHCITLPYDKFVFKYCQEKYPQHFFSQKIFHRYNCPRDIIYDNS